MPTRMGDLSIEERINVGQCELSHFYPDESDKARDAYTAITGSPMRTWLWYDEQVRKPHQSTRRDGRYAPSLELPEEVVSNFIEIKGKKWNYRTDKTSSGIRRVFIERNQAIELDIGSTLDWLSAGEYSPRREEILSQLTEEAKDLNNQSIMQLMYESVKKGEPLLPRSSKILKSAS